MYVGCRGATYIYACCLNGRALICGKILFFGSEKYKKGASSLHREMERPSKQVAWSEVKFSITIIARCNVNLTAYEYCLYRCLFYLFAS
jgi:hypothetical protein